MGVTNWENESTIGVSLRPKRYDIEIYRGDSFKFYLGLNDDDENPIDITGWTGRCQVRDTSGATIIDTPTVTIEGPPSDGTLLVDFGVTSDVEPGEYKYDVETTDSGGNVRTFIGGKFTVTVDVTE